ncbi:hypothetical protein RE0356_14340 [Prescottella equi]|nr:hypothetical protein RE0356_14340 [Prescottella equi]
MTRKDWAPRRQPAKASDRVKQGGCQWKRHEEFSIDAGKLGTIDADTWASLKRLLVRAAQGTVRDEEWEYPCALANGRVGELRMEHAGEVTDDEGIDHEVTFHYRTYYHEPRACPTDLWAMALGLKHIRDPDSASRQNDDIARAKDRVLLCDPQGHNLLAFNLGYG